MSFGLKKIPPTVFAAMLILAILALASFFYSGTGYEQQDLERRFLPPLLFEGADPDFPLGSDQLGRCMFQRILAGIKISYLIAVSGTLAGAIIGTFMGFLATRLRGFVEEIIMMLVDIQASLPFILIAISMLMIVKSSFFVILILLGVAGWEKYARLTRSLGNSAMNHGYALAARTLGASRGRIFFRHILPNIASALIVNMTLNFPGIMIAESSLSFLGLGVQPPMVSLGRLLGEGRVYLSTAWWVAVLPGSVIFMSTLAMTIIGDWMRDFIGAE